MDIRRKEEGIIEDETYHMIVDEGLERRLAALGAALTSAGDEGAALLGIDPRAKPRPGYRLVLPCTRDE